VFQDQSPLSAPSRRGSLIAGGLSGSINYMSTNIVNEPQTSSHVEHREGPLARTIEQQTAKVPSDWFLWAALGSVGASLALKISGESKTANFVGQWAPTFLILGLYNKLVKLQGSEGR